MRLSTSVKEDIERVQECIEEVKALEEKANQSVSEYFKTVKERFNHS